MAKKSKKEDDDKKGKKDKSDKKKKGKKGEEDAEGEQPVAVKKEDFVPSTKILGTGYLSFMYLIILLIADSISNLVSLVSPISKLTVNHFYVYGKLSRIPDITLSYFVPAAIWLAGGLACLITYNIILNRPGYLKGGRGAKILTWYTMLRPLALLIYLLCDFVFRIVPIQTDKPMTRVLFSESTIVITDQQTFLYKYILVFTYIPLVIMLIVWVIQIINGIIKNQPFEVIALPENSFDQDQKEILELGNKIIDGAKNSMPPPRPATAGNTSPNYTPNVTLNFSDFGGLNASVPDSSSTDGAVGFGEADLSEPDQQPVSQNNDSGASDTSSAPASDDLF